MIVPSLPFLAFAAIAASIYNISRVRPWRSAVLLVVNLVFLASFSQNVVALIPFATFLVLGFVAQRITRDGSGPRLFVLLLLVTLAMFFWLKRYSFIPSATYLGFPYVLVGLSYVFFRVLHLIIDSHQDALGERVGIVSYTNYVLNFTSLTSGPIQRYQDYRRYELTPAPLDPPAIGMALERIVVGYFKVAVVSLALSTAQHDAIADLLTGAASSTQETVWRGVLVAAIYPLYLYFNFSGYTDVVIGVGRFFGIVLPENFNRPFSSENFIAFWSRWHITLSSWLKTYVYNPLMMAGMARITAPAWAPYLAVVAFFVTFFLVGLWHGQTSEFLFFGLLQGGGVAANKLYQVLLQDQIGRKRYRALAANRVYHAACRGLTFTWFTFTLLWFWSSWAQIGQFSSALGPVDLALVWAAVFVGSVLILALLEALRAAALSVRRNGIPVITSRYVRTSWNTAILVVTVTIIVLLDSPAPDIVYKTF